MSTIVQELINTATPRDRLLRRVAEILVCPHCHGRLSEGAVIANGGTELCCDDCGDLGEQAPSQFRLGGFTSSQLCEDSLNRLKEAAKRRLGSWYPVALSILAPVLARIRVPEFIDSFDTSTDLVADLGSGTNSYSERVVCVDGGSYPNVHVTADLARLPFRDDSLSGVVSVAVLEHVPNPVEHVREFLRVLKPGGRVLCYIPFLQGFHASPHDYQRYTAQGMRRLFAEFEDIRVTVGAGPTSALIWVLQEWLALTLSFGSAKLYRCLLPMTWLLSPLKYFDLLLARHPSADVIASACCVEATKPGVTTRQSS